MQYDENEQQKRKTLTKTATDDYIYVEEEVEYLKTVSTFNNPST